MADLKGKRIWLTGASMGIGRAVALELASRGAILGLTARDEDKLRQIVQDIEQCGGKAIALAGDVTDAEQTKHIAEKMRSQLGGIDILISNAGTHIFTKPLQFDAAEYQSLMNLNYGGLLHCMEAVLPAMIERGNGHIVGVASLSGYRGVPRAAAYGASKAAAINFLESVRFHLEDAGVKVTIVNPGFVRTPLTDKNDFKMPFLTEPDRAARIICDGISRQKDEIAFPFLFSRIIKLMRIIPYPLYKLIMSKAVKR